MICSTVDWQYCKYSSSASSEEDFGQAIWLESIFKCNIICFKLGLKKYFWLCLEAYTKVKLIEWINMPDNASYNLTCLVSSTTLIYMISLFFVFIAKNHCLFVLLRVKVSSCSGKLSSLSFIMELWKWDGI